MAYHDAALPMFQGSCGVSGSEMGQQKAISTKDKDVLQVYMMYCSIRKDYCYTDNVITKLENVQLVLNFSGGLRFNSTESYSL